MMKRIFIPTRDGADWQHLLAKPTYALEEGGFGNDRGRMLGGCP